MLVNQTTIRRSLITLLLIVLSVTMIGAVSAQPFPERISLPDGFQPEGIASGNGTTFYVGSIPTGDIFRGDFRTGEGEVFIDAPSGRSAVGLKYDSRTGFLFVAGGATGFAYVYDTATGETVAAIHLTTGPRFINDVVVTKDAAYFTNSAQPVLYRVPLENNGQLPDTPTVEEIPLGGDYQFTAGQFNANGIAATPNGKTLIIVNTFDGVLYNVDPTTGDAKRIDLGSENVVNGDGILLQGKTLYVVQNFLNQIAVVNLNPDFTEGTIVDTISSDLFAVPTTIARFGHSLYAVNSHFDIQNPTPDTEYEVIGVTR